MTDALNNGWSAVSRFPLPAPRSSLPTPHSPLLAPLYNPPMLPPLRQRIVLTLSLILGGACLWPMGDGHAVVDAGPWLLRGEGVMLVVLALPAVALGLIASAAGHPGAGLFVLAVSLLMPAMVGGPIDPWLLRLESPGAFTAMAVESLAYAGLIAAYAVVIRALRPKLRGALPGPLRSEHLGSDDPWRLQPASIATTLGAMVLVGGVFAWLLLRSSYTGQVTGGLLAAFVLAGLIVHSFVPRPSLLATAIAPCVVGAIGFLLVTVQFATADDLLKAWFAGDLPGLALARPIDYASAGVAGGVMGAGLAQALAHAREMHVQHAA